MRRTVSGANLSFWYRIDSEAGGDVFTFYRDGNADIQASGTIGWTFYSVSVPPGSHTLPWEYANDGGSTAGSDAVWIDDLEVGVDDRIWTDIAPPTAHGATSASWTPGETGATFKIRARVQNADGSHRTRDESDDMIEVSQGDTIPTVSERGMMVMTVRVLAAGSTAFGRHSHGRLSNMPNGFATRKNK